MSRPAVELPAAFDDVELAEVVVQSFSASLLRLARVEGLQFALGTSWALNDDEGLLCRFEARCSLFDVALNDIDPDDEAFVKEHQLARLRCAIVCEYDVPASGREEIEACDAETIRRFSQEVALPIAFPYIREAVSSMSTRLGFPRVTLGAFHNNTEMSFASRSF
jgi:hypothetical protein